MSNPAEAQRLLGEAERLLASGRPQVARYLLDSLPDAAHPCLAALASRLALTRARAALACNDSACALPQAAAAAALAPTSPAAIGLYATLLMDRGAFAQAATLLNTSIEAGAADAGLHAALAVALLSLNEAAGATIAIDRGLRACPAAPILLRLRAASCLPHAA